MGEYPREHPFRTFLASYFKRAWWAIILIGCDIADVAGFTLRLFPENQQEIIKKFFASLPSWSPIVARSAIMAAAFALLTWCAYLTFYELWKARECDHAASGQANGSTPHASQEEFRENATLPSQSSVLVFHDPDTDFVRTHGPQQVHNTFAYLSVTAIGAIKNLKVVLSTIVPKTHKNKLKPRCSSLHGSELELAKEDESRPIDLRDGETVRYSFLATGKDKNGDNFLSVYGSSGTRIPLARYEISIVATADDMPPTNCKFVASSNNKGELLLRSQD